jgi:diguanylate cyclase (GGDEF)-like protein
VPATVFKQNVDSDRLVAALSAAQDPLDGLAILYDAGSQFGLNCWLLCAEDDSWHGYLFSRSPVAAQHTQEHVQSLSDVYRSLVSDACARPAPSGRFPVQAACEEAEPVCFSWETCRDYELRVGEQLVGLLRTGSLHRTGHTMWEQANSLVAIASPHLAHLLTRCEDGNAAIFDPLTGLYSRAYFYDQLAREVRRAACYCCEISLLMIDVVPMGSATVTARALKGVARLLATCTRRTDICARLASDRFAVLMPHTGSRQALIAATRIKEGMKTDLEAFQTMRVRIGVSGWNCHGPDATELLNQASEAARMAGEAEGGPFLYL